MTLGQINLETYLQHVQGLIVGSMITDAKDRQYRQEYDWKEFGNKISIKRKDGFGDEVIVDKIIPLDECLVSFFGLYSGDGAKGSEDTNNPKRIIPTISFSQKEKHLVRFAVDQFIKLFPGNIRFTFSLGEDSAYFMAGLGKQKLIDYYNALGNSELINEPLLDKVRPMLSAQDKQYAQEIRYDVQSSNEQNLAFYYHHKAAMEAILTKEKDVELTSVGINTTLENIKVTASLRRPFKKGARTPGGSSRSDEIHVGGLNGIGELFIKIMHEIEDTILLDIQTSSTSLIEWNDLPSNVGQYLDVHNFYTTSPFGVINNERPIQLTKQGDNIIGKWRRSNEAEIKGFLRIDPLWCYIAGLYLAEGSTPKEALFKMFAGLPRSLALGFTSSEGISLELMLRTLQKLFPIENCLETWKVKVGSQYFPELVVTGLKNGIPMLRGGESGDGKLRTVEISLSIKEWALDVADLPLNGQQSLLRKCYSSKFSHVEPTGAGVARIDFSASSTICRWYFPLLMYTVFSGIVSDPTKAFYQ